MALTTKSYAEQLGRVLAEAASNEPLVEEVWVSTHPGGVRLWLLTRNINEDAEFDLRRLADVVYQRFPSPDFEVFIVNPSHFDGDAHAAIPRHAQQIPMRAA